MARPSIEATSTAAKMSAVLPRRLATRIETPRPAPRVSTPATNSPTIAPITASPAAARPNPRRPGAVARAGEDVRQGAGQPQLPQRRKPRRTVELEQVAQR